MEKKHFGNFVIKTNEDLLLEDAIGNSLKLAHNLQVLKKVNRAENYLDYINSYNKVCETIADMRITMEQCEFMFNKNDIDRHYDYKIKELEENL